MRKLLLKRARSLILWVFALLTIYLLAWGVFVGSYRTGRHPLPAPDWLLTVFTPLYLISDWTPLQAPLESYAGLWVALFKCFSVK